MPLKIHCVQPLLKTEENRYSLHSTFIWRKQLTNLLLDNTQPVSQTPAIEGIDTEYTLSMIYKKKKKSNIAPAKKYRILSELTFSSMVDYILLKLNSF